MTHSEISEKVRLFTGITLPIEVRSAISESAARLSAMVEGVRWVPVENLHVTLKFLGSFELEKVPLIEEAMRKAGSHLPLALRIGGAGAFPSPGSARVIWVGVTDVDGDAAKVYRIIEKAAEKCGVQREKRAYRPHVTIGRAGKRPVRLPPEIDAVFDFEFRLDAVELALFRSELSGAGARYTIVSGAGVADPRE